jgi:hypothetical protein
MQGVKVLCKAKEGDGWSGEGWRSGPGGRLFIGVTGCLVEVLFAEYIAWFLFVPGIVWGLLWLLSLSCLFSLVFLPLPLLTALPLFVLRYMLKQIHAKAKAFASDVPILAKVAELFETTLWWTNSDSDVNNFSGALFWLGIYYLLAPLLVHGAWLAAIAYDGESAGGDIGAAYAYIFRGFDGFDELALPALAFDFDMLDASYFEGLLGDLASLARVDPSRFVDGYEAFTTLSFFMSLLRPAVSVASAGLAACGAVGKNVPLHVAAASVKAKDIALDEIELTRHVENPMAG